MANDRSPYGSSSQTNAGLGSSFSCLDGIPFKIGAAFRVPPRTKWPEELLQKSHSCQALNEEYSYDTEEAVLAWARAREEAKVKANVEREASDKSKAAIAIAQVDISSSDSEDEVSSAPSKQPTSFVPAALESVKSNSIDSQAQLTKPPWQLPLTSTSGSTILTPMPILLPQARGDKDQTPLAVPKASVDLAMFEKEDDPFNNLELQTINDMEELKALLEGSSIGRNSQPTVTISNNQPIDSAVNYSNKDESSVDNVDLKGTSASADPFVNSSSSNITYGEETINFDLVDSIGTSEKPLIKETSKFVIEPSADGDYVQIRPDYDQQTVSFQRDTTTQLAIVQSSAHSDQTVQFGGNLPVHLVGSKLFKPVLPPIHPRGVSLATSSPPEMPADMGRVTTNACDSSLTQNSNRYGMGEGVLTQSIYSAHIPSSNILNMPQSSCPTVPQEQSQFHALASQPNFSSSQAPLNTAKAGLGNIYSRYGNEVDASASTAVNGFSTGWGNALRAAHSNPDLSISREENLTQLPTSYSPTPPQPWNPYKPLPPTPRSHSPEVRSASSSNGSPSPDHRPSSVPPQSTSALHSPSEVDPYDSLSSEAKTFVNNLTSMGFARPRAARAVEKFGADEREVLDHLLNVDKLVEKKFNPELAEIGLLLFRNDIEKAELFLNLYQQFTELGFTGERIQTALFKHQLDRDKALDYLTT